METRKLTQRNRILRASTAKRKITYAIHFVTIAVSLHMSLAIASQNDIKSPPTRIKRFRKPGCLNMAIKNVSSLNLMPLNILRDNKKLFFTWKRFPILWTFCRKLICYNETIKIKSYWSYNLFIKANKRSNLIFVSKVLYIPEHAVNISSCIQLDMTRISTKIHILNAYYLVGLKNPCHWVWGILKLQIFYTIDGYVHYETETKLAATLKFEDILSSVKL